MTEGQQVTIVVGVRFRPLGPLQFYAPGNVDLEPGDRVLVDTESGTREGLVAIAPAQVLYSELRGPLRVVLEKLQGGEAKDRGSTP